MDAGKAYNGPKIGKVAILEDFGLNLTMFLVSGQPYTRNTTPQSIWRYQDLPDQSTEQDYPWNFTADLNLQKGFLLPFQNPAIKSSGLMLTSVCKMYLISEM
jgi:hypothetical protein